MPDHIAVPPPDIRYRIVSQEHSEQDYLAIGRDGADTILAHLGPYTDLAQRPARVLDFGCGCARTLQPLRQLVPQWIIVGTDIDEVSVAWSREHVAGATFDVNAHEPPLPYDPGSFDLIYALSVFSHLNARMEDAWLTELLRLMAPHGFLYLTFTGQRVLEQIPKDFPPRVVEAYRAKGFAYFANIGDGVLPEWYQTSLQSGDYFRRRLAAIAPGARVVEHRIGGHGGWQDSILIKHDR